MRGFWIAVAVMAGLPVAGLAQDASGLLTGGAGGGFWAKFDRPVKTGAVAHIRPQRDAEVWGHARVAWCSSLPPYEALLTDVKQTKTLSNTQTTTRYQRTVEGRGTFLTDVLPAITAGFSASAPIEKLSALPKVANPLRAALNAVLERSDVKDALGDSGVSTSSGSADAVLATLRDFRFSDPITTKLISRLKDAHAASTGVGGTVPRGFFPPELAKQKSDSGTRTTP